MFGEKPLYGNYSCKIDIKNRLVLSPYTGRENNEMVVFIRGGELGDCFLYNKKIIDREAKWLAYLILISKTEEEKRKTFNDFLKFCNSILKECIVDYHGRISTEGIFEPGEEILVIGAKDHLVLKPKIRKKMI